MLSSPPESSDAASPNSIPEAVHGANARWHTAIISRDAAGMQRFLTRDYRFADSSAGIHSGSELAQVMRKMAHDCEERVVNGESCHPPAALERGLSGRCRGDRNVFGSLPRSVRSFAEERHVVAVLRHHFLGFGIREGHPVDALRIGDVIT